MIARTFSLRTAAVTFALLLGFVCQNALAHAHLTTFTPEKDAKLASSPTAISLSFSENIEPSFSRITVLSADKKSMASGKAKVDAKKSTLTLPIKETLNPGEYTVKWQALSVDGHKTEGDYRFTVK